MDNESWQNCLICLRDFQSTSPHSKEPTQVLDDRFQVLCQYLDWARPPSESLTFDFRHEPFPFCDYCSTEIGRLHSLHEELQKISLQIHQIQGWMFASILESFRHQRGDSNSDIEAYIAIQVQKEDIPFQNNAISVGLDEPKRSALKKRRFRYYRDLTKRRFDVNVNISAKERQVCSAGVTWKAEARQKTEDQSAFDIDLGTEEQMEILVSPNPVYEGADNDDCSDDLDEPDKDLLEVDTAFVSTSAQALPTNYPPAVDFLKKFEHISPEDNKIHWFAKSTHGKKVEQMGINRFAYNRKRFFEFVDGNAWKCLHCGLKSFDKLSFLGHFERVYNGCTGNVPENAIKECKFEQYFYDELESGEHECRVCPFKCKKEKEMKNHIIQEHRSTKKTKKLCWNWKRVGPNLLTFDNHFVLEKDDDSGRKRKNLQCEKCNIILGTKSAMRHHLQRVHSAVTLNIVTSIEPNKFVTTNNITFEFRGDHHYCMECGFVIGSYKAMLNHVRQQHTHKKDLVCEVCGNPFNDIKQLRYHLRKHHGVGQDLACGQCDKVFKIANDLRYHVNTVHAEKNVLCETCGKGFATPGLLKVHMKCHTQVACKICGKVFNVRTIRGHMDTHSTEPKYECKVCHKKFKIYSAMTIHKPICGGKKPYKCDICGKGFRQKSTVPKHKQSFHSTPSYPGKIRKSPKNPIKSEGVGAKEEEHLHIRKSIV